MKPAILIELLAFFFILSVFSNKIRLFCENFLVWIYSFPKGHKLRKFILFILFMVTIPIGFAIVSKSILLPFLKADINVKEPLYAIPLRSFKLHQSHQKIKRLDYSFTNRKNISESFQNHIITNPQKGNTYRIAFLGNSIAYGGFLPYEETFGALLENKFQEEGLPIRIYNLAIHGCTPLETLTLLNEASKQHINAVVWIASYRECAEPYNKGIKILPYSDIPYLIEHDFLDSKTLKKLNQTKWLFFRKIKNNFSVFNYTDISKAFMHSLTLQYLGNPQLKAGSTKYKDNTVYYSFKETLTQIADLCQNKSIQLMVIYTPSPKEIMEKEMPDYYESWHGKNKPFELINEVFSSKGFKNNFDLTGILKKNQLYDGYHPTKEGIQVIKNFLYPKIKKLYETKQN